MDEVTDNGAAALEANGRSSVVGVSVVCEPVHELPGLFSCVLEMLAKFLIALSGTKLVQYYRTPVDKIRFLRSLNFRRKFYAASKRPDQRNQTFTKLHSNRLLILSLYRSITSMLRLFSSAKNPSKGLGSELRQYLACSVLAA